MNNNHIEDDIRQMEEKLWEYIDGFSLANDKTMIEKLLKDNEPWRDKYQELLIVHQLINASELESPSMRFTKNVMDEIAKNQISPATKSYINKNIIWGIGIFFLTLITGILIYGIAQIDWSVTNDESNFPKINYNTFFNNNFVNAFMMINVVLGLMLLDRVLAGKRRQHQSKTF